MSSFHVDARVSVKLEYELAVRLGEFLLGSGTDDKQILALGHKLNNLEEEEEPSQQPVRFSNIVNNSYRSYKKDWNRNDMKTNNEDNSSNNNEEKPRRINLRRRATV